MSVEHLVNSGLVCLSGNPIQITTWASASKLNQKLLLKVSCPTLFGSPFIEEIAPDSELTARFDISGLVDQPVDYEFDFPSVGKVKAHDALAFMVTIDIGESWIDENDDLQEAWQNISSNNIIRVLKGKLRAYELALLNDQSLTFQDKYIDGGLFLTHLPQNMKVSPTQSVKLWYLSPWTDYHDATLNFQVETDNKSAHLPIQNDLTLIGWGLFEFSMSYDFMGFYPDPNEKVIAYTFWLSERDGGPDITERRRFVVNNNYFEKSFTFYYVNPLSGVESIWLTGEFSEGLKTESETSYRKPPFNSGSKLESITTTSSSGQRTWQINTGILSRTEILALRDFLQSKKRWMVDQDNAGKLIPVYIESEDYTLYNSMDDLQSLEIKVLEANQ